MPNATDFQLHIFAALAQEERRLISERTRNALAEAKLRGAELGKNGKVLAVKNRKAALDRAEGLRPVIIPMIECCTSLSQIARTLNELGYTTAMGSWQHCRVHFMRNILAHAGKSGRRVVSAFIGTAFAQETPEAASQQWRAIADQMRPKLPKLAALMDDAEPDVLAYMTFPREHRAKLHSTNPIERLNGEIKRRTDVVGIFPNEAAITRLVGAILMEQSDEWAVQRARYMTLETMAPLSDNPIIMLSAVPGT